MIAIENILISDDLADEYFVCDLNACKGGCCVHGEDGAPLTDEELTVLDDIFEDIKPYLTEKGIEAIEKNGKYYPNEEGAFRTTLIDGKDCAYVNFENGIAVCGIEKAHQDGVTDFQKPVSCHLYPVRIHAKEELEMVNYERWDICSAACSLGKKEQVPLYKFLKNALIRKYGKDFYEMLEAAINYSKQNT